MGALGFWCSTIGLVLDIFGVVLLFKFGLPEDVEKYGGGDVVGFGHDDAAVEAVRTRYLWWGRVGLCLLMAGFVLQMIGNRLQYLASCLPVPG